MEPLISVGAMCLLSAKNVDISLTIFLSCVFPKISAVHTQKGPLYEYYHVLSTVNSRGEGGCTAIYGLYGYVPL